MRILITISCILSLAVPAFAQVDDFEAVPEKTLQPERKQPGFFRRPAKDSPSTQLQYARTLAADGKTKAAIRQYGVLVHTWHDTPEAAKAQLAYARLLEKIRRYKRAFEEYQYLIDYYFGTFEYDQVLSRQMKIARHIMTGRAGKLLFFPGVRMPERAVPLFEKIVENGPMWEGAPEAQIHIGQIHEQAKDYDLAVIAYRKVQQLYPKSPYAEQAAFRRAHCLYILSNMAPRDENSCRNALSAAAAFLRDYPAGEQSGKIVEYRDKLKERLVNMYYRQAEFYDRIAGKPDSAVIAYRDFLRRFPSSTLAEKAEERIDVLTKKMEKKNEMQ